MAPLPQITTLMEDLVGVTLCSTFDMVEGYYHIRVKKELQDILAFTTTMGLFAPTVMPFEPLM